MKAPILREKENKTKKKPPKQKHKTTVILNSAYIDSHFLLFSFTEVFDFKKKISSLKHKKINLEMD